MNDDCNECGAAASDDVVVGTRRDEVRFVCHRCRSATLTAETTLTQELADIAAVKQLSDAATEEIADRLRVDGATVEHRQARIESEVAAAVETLERLDRTVGLDNIDPDEFQHFHEQIERFRATVEELPSFQR